MRIAIIGGGLAGLTAAWELSRIRASGAPVEPVLFEGSGRLGGLVETVREGGFTIETGPDGWLSAKPAAAELAAELGLGDELIGSNDATRKTWILLRTPERPAGRLVALPDGMTLMVPSDLNALEGSALFSREAVAAYRAEPGRAAELLASVPAQDESVAAFTLRHFGPEVLERVAAPLLSGVFGGDVQTLSARATLPGLVAMERAHGSLVAGLRAQRAGAAGGVATPLFTTLRSGVGTLVDRLTAAIPAGVLRLNSPVVALERSGGSEAPWRVIFSTAGGQRSAEAFDGVLLAVPVQVAERLLRSLDREASELLPAESSSAVLAAFCFADAARVPVPPGFGLLVPPWDAAGSGQTPTLLQACTFADQKFADRVPPGGRLLRAYFGGAAAARLLRCGSDEIAAIARLELARVLHTYTHSAAPLTGPVPEPLPEPLVTVVRRLPASLPQYAVGHLERAAAFERRAADMLPGVALLGNALDGVGLPDVIRGARAAARRVVE